MRIQLESMRSLFSRAIPEAGPTKDEKLRLYRRPLQRWKVPTTSRGWPSAPAAAKSMMKHLPLERMYRDSRCNSLVAPGQPSWCSTAWAGETLYEAGGAD